MTEHASGRFINRVHNGKLGIQRWKLGIAVLDACKYSQVRKLVVWMYSSGDTRMTVPSPV